MRVRAFTLLELMVTVALITLLMAILLPTLSDARDHSKTVICGSNVRQLATAGVLYAQDWDAYVGYAPGIDRKMLLYPYLQQGKNNADIQGTQVWHCPKNADPASQCGYGFNTLLNWVKLTSVANWSQTVALCDSGIRDHGVSTLSTMCNPPSVLSAGTNYAYRPNPRHLRGAVEVAFVDGHAEPFTMTPTFYPSASWTGNGITNAGDANYKDQLWDLQ